MECEGQLRLSFPAHITRLEAAKQAPSGDPFSRALELDEEGHATAREWYLRCVDEGSHVADALCNLSTLASSASHRHAAIYYLLEALKEDPRHPEAHFNLGNLYLEKDLSEPAAVHFELAVEFDPGMVDAYYNLALAYASTKNWRKALVALETFLGASEESTEDALSLHVTLVALLEEGTGNGGSTRGGVGAA